MTERTIARRYVRALFELALEQQAADGVLADLERLMAEFSRHPAELSALLDPRTEAAKKRAVIDRRIGEQAKPLTVDFCRFLLDRRRERLLLQAPAEFAAMLREQRGEAVAEVSSAAPLDAETRAALVARLADLTRRKVTLDEKVDATLLGGVRVKVGSLLLDGSARRRLAGMREELGRVTLPKPAASGAA